jgi:DNA-binding NtrC family response regulator
MPPLNWGKIMPPAASLIPDARYRVVVVTTDERVRPEVEAHLADYQLHMIQTWDELVALIKKNPLDGVLLDLDVVGDSSDDGIEALRTLRSLNPDFVLVGLTRSNRRSLRLKALDAGVDEYFVAPLDLQEVRLVLGRALEKRELEVERRERQGGREEVQAIGDLIGVSEAMQHVYQAIQRVADSSTTVLVRGESGTGKELVARAIVSSGGRREKPFISINCAALPENLIETELFGHEKGAFTDARTSRPGHIELAHTGTLFLDEIATLGLALQSKLLRVLEDRTVTRIGGTVERRIDFRLITATNENLEDLVHTGRFREDLYYRINVVPIDLPPLRERGVDIAILFHHFLRQYSAANHLPVKQIEPDGLEILEQYSWPGNVRELENLVQRLVLMVDGPVIMAKHLPQQILSTSATSQESLLIPEKGVSFEDEIARIEVAYLEAALRRCGGSKIEAARLLHMDRQKMHYLCRKYGIGRASA